MRESLGIALDDTSISSALVDADIPALGSIDDVRHPWGTAGNIPSAHSTARALASAVDVATERAARSHLHPTAIGVLCERPDVRDLLPQLLSAREVDTVELVNSLDARLAYLQSVPALVGVSPILAFWPDGNETVIAALDPAAGTLDSAHRYNSAELLANSSVFAATLDHIVAEHDPFPKKLVALGTPDETKDLAAVAAEHAALGFLFLPAPGYLAIGAALVAAARTSGSSVSPVLGGAIAGAAVGAVASSTDRLRGKPLMLISTLLVMGGLLVGLLVTLAPDNARTATTDQTNNDRTPSTPTDEQHPGHDNSGHRPEIVSPGGSGQSGGQNRDSAGSPPSFTPPPTEILPPCDPVLPAEPAGLRRSDPDLPTTAPAPARPLSEIDDACVPTRHG